VSRARAKQKQKQKLKDEGQETKARRAEELRSLFDQAGAPLSAAPMALEKTQVTTNTPTPTVPSGVHTLKSGVSGVRTHRPELTMTRTRPAERTVISSQPYRPAQRIDGGADISSRTNSQIYAPLPKKKETEWWLGPLLMLSALLLLGLGWLHIERNEIARQAVGHPTTADRERERLDRIEFYRTQLGQRLNRSRVDTELKNERMAPRLSETDTPRAGDSMMRGVPLMPENYESRFQDRKEPVHPDHPDARIQYGLQDEQHHDEFQKVVEREYVTEFVENARRQGYNIKLDKNLNVIDVTPVSGEGRRPGSSPGVAR
jgi:hypothetical protein